MTLQSCIAAKSARMLNCLDFNDAAGQSLARALTTCAPLVVRALFALLLACASSGEGEPSRTLPVAAWGFAPSSSQRRPLRTPPHHQAAGDAPAPLFALAQASYEIPPAIGYSHNLHPRFQNAEYDCRPVLEPDGTVAQRLPVECAASM